MDKKQTLIIGVVLPVAVGIILLAIEHGFFSKPSEHSARPITTYAPSSTSQQSKTLPSKHNIKQKSTDTLSMPAKKQDEKVVPNSDIDKSDLETLRELASYIHGVDPRNAEYIKIVGMALNRDDAYFALDVADDIYGVDARNSQYVAIIDYALQHSNVKFAKKVADKMYGVDARNSQYKKIIMAASQRKASNKSSKRDAVTGAPS